MSQPMERYTVWQILFILLGLAGITAIYIGFYSPDPYAVGRWGRVSQLLLTTIRIGMPCIVIGILILIHLIKIKKAQFANVALLFGSLILAVVIAFPFANAKFKSWLDIRQKRDLFHPYLQLAPQKLDGVDDSMDFKIFCLGGSTTEFLDSQDRDWPDRVESLLNEKSDKKVHVSNQGRQWYTTQHSLINYEINLRHHQPDILIVMHTINDLLHNADFCYFSFAPFKEDYSHFYGPLSRILTNPTLISTMGDFISMFWYHTPREVVEQTEFPGLAPFKRNLNTLIDLAKKDGVQVILMTQPNLYKVDISDKEKSKLAMLNSEAIGDNKKWSYNTAFIGFQKYTEAVKEIAAERNVILIDLEQAVPKTLEYFDDDVHYEDIAFDLVANTITTEILYQNILD
ncbi:SGNH/GDSL hydrolase family protein [candidate division KSB1 bacterium]|nr:SGNH/GDSL hydrolase family protein [candidate division KSB1 bacterium]